MDKTINLLVRVFIIFVIIGCLIAYLNLQKGTSSLHSKSSIEDLRYKYLEKKRANAEFAAKRDSSDYEKFGSSIFCNSSFNSWIDSVNYSNRIDFYLFGKDADLSEWDNAIKDYEDEKTKM